MPGKREEYLTWEEKFMANALLETTRSKDPSTQVGACIVKNKKILSTGYNGLTRGMSDDVVYWNSIGEKTGERKKIKNPWVVHAELNAILNYHGSSQDMQGSTLYVTLFPCGNCANAIIQAGIKKVVWLRMYSDKEDIEMTKERFDAAGVIYEQYIPDVELIKEDAQKLTLKLQELLKKDNLKRRILEKRKYEKLFDDYLNEKIDYKDIHFSSSIPDDEGIVLRKKIN